MTKILSEGKGAVGHNGGRISQKAFLKLNGDFDALESRAAKLRADRGAFWKRAKEDGLDRVGFEWARKQASLDAAERAAAHNTRYAYLKYLGFEDIAAGMSEVDENASDEIGLTEEQREAKWRDHGKRAGLAGATLSSADVMKGHDPNSDVGRWIIAGWEAGQAELAKEIKPADKASDAGGKLTGGVQPKDEPEVAAAKRRGRPPKSGLTYWHNPETRKVFEVTLPDSGPEGAVAITRPEYEKLQAEYAKAEQEAWEQSAPDDGGGPPSPDDDGFGQSPSPAKH